MSAALRRAAPLIFFNSCQSGRLGFSLTRLGSWGAEFVRLGCGGFVGTLWPVTDRAASAFAQAFYRSMFEGRSHRRSHATGEAASARALSERSHLAGLLLLRGSAGPHRAPGPKEPRSLTGRLG